MEQAIRGARTQSGLTAAPLQDPNYGSAKPSIRRQRRSDFALKSGRRERNFWMRRQGAKNSRQNARTPAETKIPGSERSEIPAETLYLASYRKRAVCGEGPNCQLPTQRSNPSPPLEPGTESFDAETGAQKPPLRLLETDTETR
jgi:hypothetical protein